MSDKKQTNLEIDIQVLPAADVTSVTEEPRRAIKPGPRAAFREGGEAGGISRHQWSLSKGNRR